MVLHKILENYDNKNQNDSMTYFCIFFYIDVNSHKMLLLLNFSCHWKLKFWELAL